MDRIAVGHSGSERIEKIIGNNSEIISTEVLADAISGDTEGGDLVKEWNINGEKVTLSVTRK